MTARDVSYVRRRVARVTNTLRRKQTEPRPRSRGLWTINGMSGSSYKTLRVYNSP